MEKVNRSYLVERPTKKKRKDKGSRGNVADLEEKKKKSESTHITLTKEGKGKERRG